MTGPLFDLVVPTVGRPSLATLLEALAGESAAGAGRGQRAAPGPSRARGAPLPGRLLVIDDRREGGPPLEIAVPEPLAGRTRVVRGRGAGPAAARNLGWRLAGAPWVAFIDDDVMPDPGWLEALDADLSGLDAAVAGSQGRLRVPLPEDRRPTDWERNVAALAGARWVTADMAYRRSVLAEVGGFDERFPRAYREDSDLALRVVGAGHRIERGQRTALHPVRPAGPLVSVRLQAGNADDVLMRALHGPDWRAGAGESGGRRLRHLATTLAGLAGLGALALRRRRLAAAAGAAWLAGTAELAWARIAPGPRDPRELGTMALTSALIPPAATWHRLGGLARLRRLLGAPGPCAADTGGERARPAAADGCACRKPAPGLVEAAAAALGVDPRQCVVIGDVGTDVEAAHAAGALAVLVPTAATLGEEVAAAPAVAADLEAAVDLLLGPEGTSAESTRETSA